MNFLAHLHLSDGTPDSMFGNMLADFVKGRAIDELTPGLRQGVREHRRLDLFTDKHPVFLESVVRIRPQWGRYSPILIDIYYDHFLAAEWTRYCDRSLRDYLDNVYTVYQTERDRLPGTITMPMDRLIRSDRLMTYAAIEGVEDALLLMSGIFRKDPKLHLSIPVLVENYEELREDFHRFYPDAIEFMKEGRRED